MTKRKFVRYSIVMLSILLLALAAVGCGSKSKNDETALKQTETVNGSAAKQWSTMPEMTIDPKKSYTATFHTSKGDFKVELFADEAPTTVNNFVFLAKQKFYEGITFHRIIETFMIQTGDPNGDGSGGPGYHIPDELGSDLKYEVGTVAMARTRAPDSGGSQFFICTGEDSLNLNQTPDYAIFGKVIEGMDTVMAIAKSPVEMSSNGELSKPVDKITINSIDIEEI
ncbi:cyclophilin family peptidyl-prolyl cis-trans isomerase [Paenibacillus cellulosilyticus]|uniref:Peptidyl-prolyl cis-trans isomerase n=1 Tax=Paenibacillus cellulosilyticus TaxID=375489 RepID=A0A2V2YRM7_9BACL|nr:peptidylprolyl isomerase [Paenibacillus cellulosilyticus]PWW00664.1 cyclophilin family peptidyl-prolyl cis-trans isomerase [Paenibacillus cellulosilyticus]QKS45529.1 peptidylprolyl isomerase [Paenibacillus cellulosilyticus]